MVAAGVSLIRALNIVAEQIENVKLRKAVQACVAQVEGGSSFSEAMSADPDSLFPPIMVNMVRAGETGGFLDKSLLTVADSFEADVRLQGQIKSAMAYPVAVLGIALILVMVMLLTIVPMFASMYDSMNAQLRIRDPDPGGPRQSDALRASDADRGRRGAGHVLEAQP